MDFMNNKKKGSVILIPVAYEKNLSWLKGASKGPEIIIKSSNELEFYDLLTDSEPFFYGFETKKIIRTKKEEDMIIKTKKEVNKALEEKKFFIIIGGDHSTGIPGLPEREDYNVLQLDAHPDLFYSWNNSTNNHRTFGFHAKKHGLILVGIRSLDKDELEIIKKEKISLFKAKDINKECNNNKIKRIIKKIINSLKKEKVILSIDVDVFDPSLIRNTGTPEPEGLNYNFIIELLEELFKKKKLLGAHIVEFSPRKDYEVEAYIISKLIYQIIGLYYKYQKKEKKEKE